MLISKSHQHKFQTSKPGFKRFQIFSEELVGVEVLKSSVCLELDRPIYVGAAILDLSKVLMYRTWYNTLKPRYQENKLCFTGMFKH